MKLYETTTHVDGLPEGDSTIEVYGKVVIEDKTPIPYNGESIEIIGMTPDAELTLIATEELQPCIGLPVHTGMSFGRWEMPTGKALEYVNIKRCKVTMRSKTKGFTIGKINIDYAPKFLLLDKTASIDCPEFFGYRRLIQEAYPPIGSTKISTIPEYALVKCAYSPIPFNNAQEKAIKEAKEAGADLSLYTASIDAVDMKSMTKYFKLGVDIYPVARHYENVKRHVAEYLSCLLCGVPEDDEKMLANIKHFRHFGILAEAKLQERKWFYAYKKLFNKEPDENTDVYKELKQHAQKAFPNVDSMNALDIEFWWELIDLFAYSKIGTHLDDVKYFIFGMEV